MIGENKKATLNFKVGDHLPSIATSNKMFSTLKKKKRVKPQWEKEYAL